MRIEGGTFCMPEKEEHAYLWTVTTPKPVSGDLETGKLDIFYALAE